MSVSKIYMLDKETAKKKLKELVEQFASASKNKDFINSQNEEWIKWNYLEPLFEILGWKKGDIEKEKRVLKGRADYMLKIGNEEVLVIEAKKAGVNLSEDEGRQAVSYAYHRKVKFAVVTNFKEIKVYHALTNIKFIDHNLLKFESGGLFRFSFEQFIENFDKLMILSRESFENKYISKLLPSKLEKASKPIDESILEDLLVIRELLSKDLKKVRTNLEKEQIDEIVQLFIDRMIFMRSVEDRGLEEKDFLRKMVMDYQEMRSDKRLWVILREKFKIFDKEYNSKLFAEGLLEKEGAFDDETIIKVIKILYFGAKELQARYMFDIIPGDLLGNIYEQYLGTILQGTEKRVTLNESSGKRKKMGIYYTPSYIVDYIVKNTVGEYIKNKTIDEILEVRIVDPACGSGSFLIRAFQEVCDIIEQKLKSGEKSKNAQFQFYKERLSLGQKASILSNCIYGVDLDEKAVELAQLNLLLKLLEEETPDTHKRLLPNLRDNIKNGNSLIDDSAVSDRAFNWHSQFKSVFDNGGFDVVIGNPPYVRNRELINKEKDFLSKNFETAEGQYDIYQLFFEKSINILKADAILGFITSNKYAITSYGKKLRKFILDNTNIRFITDVSNISVFKEASTYPYILILTKNKIHNKKINVTRIENPKEIFEPTYTEIEQISLQNKSDYTFNININENQDLLLNKICTGSVKLGDIVNIKETVHTGNIREKILTKNSEKHSKKILRGKDCQRYYFIWANLWINLDASIINKKMGEYATIPNELFFNKPKLFLREIAEKITACYDNNGFYSLNKAYVINMTSSPP